MGKVRAKAGGPADGEPAPAGTPAVPRSRPPDGSADAGQPGDLTDPPVVGSADFETAFAEPLDRVLDIDTWDVGPDASRALDRLDEELRRAIAQESDLVKQVRKVMFPQIAARPNAPKGAGVFKATRRQLEDTQARVLFNGGVEACDGTRAVHDTLPLTVAQIGVCLVSYQGQQGAWGHRLFRHDLRQQGQGPLSEGEALDLLERRQQRAGVDQEGQRDRLTELGQRGIMSYAERAVLLRKSEAPWRMGHGHPAPYELVTGSGCMEFLRKSLTLLSELILDYKRFVFVPSAPGERVLLTIGYALRPYEFAVVETAEWRLGQILEKGHLRGEYRDLADGFTKEAGPDVLTGVYRTDPDAPPQLFYAHADHAQDAALVAMADSLLQPHRSFPTLIDLADTVCSGLFGAEGFSSTVRSAYARSGHPLRYLGERETRR